MSERKPVVADEVRAWAREQEQFEGIAALNPNARGRLPKVVIDGYNKSHRNRLYTPGNSATVALQYPAQDKRGRHITKTAQVSPSELRTLSGTTAQRGRLTEAAVSQAGLNYAASL